MADENEASSAEVDALAVNPKIEALVEISKDGPIVELKGFIGFSGDDRVVRLYTALSTQNYIDIPKKSIRFSEYIRDDPDGKTHLLVARSAPVTRVHTDYVTAGDLDQKVAGRYKLPWTTLEAGCKLLRKVIDIYEKAIRDGYIELPGGGYLALTEEQIEWLQGQLNTAREEHRLLECSTFGW